MENLKRILAGGLLFTLVLSSVVTYSSKSIAKTQKENEDQKVICIDAGHQTRANTGKEPIGPGANPIKMKVTGGCKRLCNARTRVQAQSRNSQKTQKRA